MIYRFMKGDRRLTLPLFLAAAMIVMAAAPALAGPGVGDPAIDFTLPDDGGTDHTLSDYTGKVIVLAFLTST